MTRRKRTDPDMVTPPGAPAVGRALLATRGGFAGRRPGHLSSTASLVAVSVPRTAVCPVHDAVLQQLRRSRRPTTGPSATSATGTPSGAATKASTHWSATERRPLLQA